MKTSLSFLFLLTFSMQVMSQAVNVRTDKSPGDIAITSIQHPCIGTVNGVDTTLGYFSALPVDQVWPIQLKAFIVNLGPTDQTNVVLTGEIVNELGTVVYTSSQLGGNLNAGFNMILTLPDLFLPTATGSYTLRMSVIQDEGDYNLTNNEMTRLILDVNANGVISRIFEMNAAIEIPTGAGTVNSNAGLKFAIPNPAEILSLSVFIDTMIQPQTYLTPYLLDWSGTVPLVQVIGEPIEINASSNNSWVDLPFIPISPSDLDLFSFRHYIVTIEAQNYSGIASVGADDADFHEFDVESYFDGYSAVQTKIPAIKINLKYDIGAESPNLVDNIHIYPNPVTDILFIETPSKTGELRLMNAFGQLLAIQSIQDTNTRLDLSAQPAGIYTLQIKDKSKTLKTTKLIKLTSH